MKHSRLLLSTVAVLLFGLLPAHSCGPFFDELLFLRGTAPDGPYAAYARGELGVPQPGWRVLDFVVAYDWLNGAPLSAEEQQQAVALDARSDGEATDTGKTEDDDNASVLGWIRARNATGVPGGPADPKTYGDRTAYEINLYRHLPGEDYESFVNCLPAAFSAATHTLQTRTTAHADDKTSLADWLHGQDAVFSNCGDELGAKAALPAPPAADAPLWLRQDRSYQAAAALFYRMDYEGAIRALRPIAADPASPWHETAALVIARAMVRRATIGDIAELPPAAIAPRNAPYSKERADALEQYKADQRGKRTARLAEAATQLQAIARSASPYREDAEHLLDFVNLRLDPVSQVRILAARATSPQRSQKPGEFRQAIIDLRAYLYPADNADNAPRPKVPNLPLLDWLTAMQGASEPPGLFIPDYSEEQKTPPASEAQAALAAWRAHPQLPWLAAALTTARSGDPAANAELVRAAAQVPRSSPAWTLATYHRLRLLSGDPAMRKELDRLLPSFNGTPQRATVNLFQSLQLASSPTLEDFLADAGMKPAGLANEEPYNALPSSQSSKDGLCGIRSSDAETALFPPLSATIFNTRMPVALMAHSAASGKLAPNLGFQLAQAAWSRAVLLNQPAVAHQLSPALIGCYPAWKAVLNAYDSSATDNDRQANGLLALMRFASTEPVVRQGSQRPEGFATYSSFRDNWWSPSSPANTQLQRPAMLFGYPISSRAELPDPPFLNATDRATAEAEIALLEKIPCASDYFAQAALDWQQKHPEDPRTPDILGNAERVVRNGCSTDATKELNHRLFVVVQSKYPKSEWARKYTTWQ